MKMDKKQASKNANKVGLGFGAATLIVAGIVVVVLICIAVWMFSCAVGSIK